MDLNNTQTLAWLFTGLVFLAMVLLFMALVVSLFGERRLARKKFNHRLADIERQSDRVAINSLLRERYLKRLNPLERRLENAPGMVHLASLIEQSGKRIPAYRLFLVALLSATLAGTVALLLLKVTVLAVLVALLAFAAPFIHVLVARNQRQQRFQEQLPEAIEIICRALKAGHPFSESLHLVAEGLDGPAGEEFEITFADLNYGNDLRRAMLGLAQRMPSVSMMALVTSVLVQKETGGNLAEVLSNISGVIRGRFRFQRKVRTLSAEGRLSAWVLMLVPVALFLVIHFTTPDYLSILLSSENGRDLLLYASGAAVIGVLWIRRILRIEV